MFSEYYRKTIRLILANVFNFNLFLMNNRITLRLLKWYAENKRDLPWRETLDPYAIWLSEIILQQTRIEQGISYYYKFLRKYPDLASLAQASDDEIMKLWQGLGYYSRARNLAHTAREIWHNQKGNFPATAEGLLHLKGIGSYTAAAIASIAFNEPVPVVDGNVLRFIARLFGIEQPVDKKEARAQITSIAQKLMDPANPGRFNQAMMEFGALQCIKHNPECDKCPLSTFCVAFQNNLVQLLPAKSARLKSRNRYFNYLVVIYNNNIYLRKRLNKDIWESLYEFPLIENSSRSSYEKLVASGDWKRFFGPCNARVTHISKEYKHILTHQKIYARFYRMEILDGCAFEPGDYLCIPMETLDMYPVSRLIEKYLEAHALS
jgi:A/G-specific adenine glycosylase